MRLRSFGRQAKYGQWPFPRWPLRVATMRRAYDDIVAGDASPLRVLASFCDRVKTLLAGLNITFNVLTIDW